MKRIEMKMVFKDRDGSLIMSRVSNASWYERDESFLKGLLASEARERGVKIVSHNYVYSCQHLRFPQVNGTIECVVEYLGRKK